MSDGSFASVVIVGACLCTQAAVLDKEAPGPVAHGQICQKGLVTAERAFERVSKLPLLGAIFL
jgi:hypothetical protein